MSSPIPKCFCKPPKDCMKMSGLKASIDNVNNPIENYRIDWRDVVYHSVEWWTCTGLRPDDYCGFYRKVENFESMKM